MIENNALKGKLDQLRAVVTSMDENYVIDKQYAQAHIDALLDYVPYAPGVNNSFFVTYMDPLRPPTSIAALKVALQNWLEQKRILRRSLVQGLEATVISEYWEGQKAYLEILTDEIDGRHVDLSWRSLRHPAKIAGFDLPHSIDAQNDPNISIEMKELRDWQGSFLCNNIAILIVVAIFEKQSQSVLRRTYQALNSWYGHALSEEQRTEFRKYFIEHTIIDDLKNNTSLEEVLVNIPINGGVEQKHARYTRDCFVNSCKDVKAIDLMKAYDIFYTINDMQYRAWNSVYCLCTVYDLHCVE